MPGSGSDALAPMVRKLSRLSPLGSVERAALLSLPHRLANIKAGEYLVREGSKLDSYVLLRSGFVHQSKVASSGARQILSIHLAGDLVSLHDCSLGEANHSVQALTRASVAYINQRAVQDLAETHPKLARAFWRGLLVDGSISQEWILNLGRRNARQRVAHLICEIVSRQREAMSAEGPDYVWPLTQDQLGDATGLTAVHVNRTLQALRRDGFITMASRMIRISDWAGLQKVADFTDTYLHQRALAA